MFVYLFESLSTVIEKITFVIGVFKTVVAVVGICKYIPCLSTYEHLNDLRSI